MARGKKQFAEINTGKLYGNIEQATAPKGQQGTASQEEQRARASALATQGRKGCQAVRINMAFTPENYEFIKILAKASGRTMTAFVNLIIQAYRNEHPELMEQARGFLDTINSGAFERLLNADKADEAEGE